VLFKYIRTQNGIFNFKNYFTFIDSQYFDTGMWFIYDYVFHRQTEHGRSAACIESPQLVEDPFLFLLFLRQF
jgi:hypothetical protein